MNGNIDYDLAFLELIMIFGVSTVFNDHHQHINAITPPAYFLTLTLIGRGRSGEEIGILCFYHFSQ